MADLWEFIKGFGALIGLMTGAFVLWERVVKDRPVAFIIREQHGPNAHSTSKLRIINRSQRPVLIWWQYCSGPHAFMIAKGTNDREIITALHSGEAAQIIDGNTTLDLPLYPPDRLNEIEPDNVIETTLRWSFVQPIIWQHPRNISVRIKKRAYQALLGEEA